MKIFLSYSTPDLDIVRKIATYIQKHATVLFWDKDKEPGKESWPTIFQWIDQSDLVLVVITGNTVKRAMAVGNEVGHAKAKSKTIIPLVAPEVPTSELGCLNSITYQPINPNNPGPDLTRINQLVLAHKQKLEQKQQQQLVLLLLAIVSFIWLGSRE